MRVINARNDGALALPSFRSLITVANCNIDQKVIIFIHEIKELI